MSPSPDEPIEAFPRWLAVALVSSASAAVLVLEILAGRLLAPYVGVSLETYTGIIGTVLVGVAAGAWAGGVAADRVNPRRLLPLLFVVGGALTLATIPVVRAVGPTLGSGGGPGIIMLTAVGFLPSATVLSAVPPAVVKLQLRDLDTTGSTVGRLSAWSTVGGIAGTFATGFVLVAVAAVTTLVVATGVLALTTGVVLWLVSPRLVRRVIVPQMFAAIALAALSIGGLAVSGSPCEWQTSYYCVSIADDRDRPTGRTLILDDLRHSYVDLDDPTHLEFWYSLRFADAIDELAPAGALDAVHIGGGAMTLPGWVQATRPASRQTVLEIDEDLVTLVIDEFDRDVGPGSGLAVVVGDARLSLQALPDDSADLVLGDAFGSRAVPWHLATEEFTVEVARVLRPGGLYMINVIDSPALAFLRAEAATIRRVFPHVVVMLGPSAAVGRRGNSVIFAADRPIDAELLDRRRALSGGGGRVIDDLDAFIADATVLTDDYAPVDQLIAGGIVAP